MKTAGPNNNGRLEKGASLFRAIAPVVAQDQDDRMRQIIREELSAHSASTQQPSVKTKKKVASVESFFSLALIDGFSDEIQKIKTAQMSMSSVTPKPAMPSPMKLEAAKVPPKNPLTAKPPTYSQVNPAPSPGPAQSHQPTLSPPPVRG